MTSEVATDGVLRKKAVFKNSAKSMAKHLCQILFFNKVSDLQSSTLLFKKRLRHTCFPVNFSKVLKTTFSCNIIGRLLLWFYR